jgi:hypothetical protein
MAGINSLPKWDPNNPTTYRYDWKNYDPRDYEKFKQARIAFDKKRQAESQKRLQETMQNAIKSITDKVKSERNNLTRNHVPVWDGESECFADLQYSKEDGGVWAWFYRGGQTPAPYFYALSEAEAREWFDGSAGGWFNDNLR